MKIVLNDQLQPIVVHEYTQRAREQRRAGGHKEFAERLISKMSDLCAPKDPTERWPKPDAQVVRGVGDHQLTQNGFANVVSEAYSTHLGLVLHPHDIWYVVLSNIATLVANNPEAYRRIYTATAEGKQELLVPTNDAQEIDVDALISELKAFMPVDVSVFLPELSTATPLSNLAMSCAVLDAAQHYYDYGMFCCGIPFIDLRGTQDDWKTLICSIVEIQGELLTKCDPRQVSTLSKYLADIYSVVCNIEASFSEDQTEFWKDIFTQKNVGSGGDLAINGWICDLYYNTKRGDLIQSFHDSISQFPYVNKTTNEHFVMFAGAFGSNVVDGAIEIAYDRVIVKYTPKDAK